MKETPKISIIVPVYNVEQYLEKCINSILSQTFKDYELILVDDGSKDRSGIMCDEFAAKDDRIIVLHKENGGLSSARNAGIDIAKGEYIGFADSDDYIAEDMYQFLYDNLIRENADLSVCGVYNCFGDKIPKPKAKYYYAFSAEDALPLIFKDKDIKVSACNKLYKKELFDSLRYPEGKISEDAFIIVDLLIRCSKVVIASDQKYYYIHRKNSIVTSKFNTRTFDVIEAYQKNDHLIAEHFPRKKAWGKYGICWACFWVLDRMIICPEYDNSDSEKKLIKYLRQHKRFVLFSGMFNKTRIISMLMLVIHKRLYKLLVKCYRKRNCYE